MTDEPTPETQADISAAVRAEIARLVPGTPLPGAAAATPPKQQARCGNPRVADTSVLNGQYRALETRVDDLRGNYQELRHDIDARFTAMGADIARQAENTNTRLDAIVTKLGEKNGNGDFTKYAGVIAVIVAIASGVIGGFIKLENDSIGDKITSQGAALADKITQQNTAQTEKTNTLTASTGKDIARLDSAVDGLEKTTIPRAELDRRIDRNATEILGLTSAQTAQFKDVATLQAEARDLKADVERMKTDVVKRDENKGHWEDYNNRLNLISSRIVELTRDLGGSNPASQIKDIRDQVNELQRRLIAVPK